MNEGRLFGGSELMPQEGPKVGVRVRRAGGVVVWDAETLEQEEEMLGETEDHGTHSLAFEDGWVWASLFFEVVGYRRPGPSHKPDPATRTGAA